LAEGTGVPGETHKPATMGRIRTHNFSGDRH
jgi:hypothetical protein